MTRVIARVTVALACACVMTTAHAQDTKIKSKTMTKGGEAQVVTYTGCVQTGTETRTYVLEKAVPVTRTTTNEVSSPSGTTTTTATTTSYELVPGESINLETAVGHKVEVTGMLIPGGDQKIKSRTKIEREDAPDTTIKEKTRAEGALPQFRVVSIKPLAESCTP